MMQQQQGLAVTYMGGQATIAASPIYLAGVEPPGVTNFGRKQSMVIGITLVISAILGFIFNSLELAVRYGSNNDYDDYLFVWGVIGHGYWAGILVIIAGGFAIAASRTPTKRRIVALNVLCIISASLTSGQFIAGIMGATIPVDCYWSRSSYTSHTESNSCEYLGNIVIAMESLLATLAVVEGIAAIWGSAICCKAYCCCCSTVAPVYYVQYQTPTAMNTGMPTMSVLNQPATITMAAMGAQPYSYPHMQSAQMTMTPPSYGFYSNQGYVHSNPGPPQPYPSADPHKMTDKNPPEYTCNGTSS